MRYVIIGNSAAAVGGIEGIRQIDKTGEITVVSREPHHTYSRPLISYLLEEKTDLQRMKYRPDSFYADNGVDFLPGRTATAVDSAKKEVALDDGSSLPYDKLLIATGSRPFVPPMKGIETVDKKYTFMTLDDALEIQAQATRESRVLIIGAGLIGIKCAEGLYKKVKKLTIIDLADRIMPNVLDYDGSKMVQYHMEGKGIEFFLSDSVDFFDGSHAVLKSGACVDFDILVIAVGVRPCTELFDCAGCKVERGALTDAHMSTGVPGIYAAGDCTLSDDISCGEKRILALLPNAYAQGECAGINMAGGEAVYDRAIPMNATKLLGLPIVTAGSYRGDVYSECESGYYKKLFYENDLLRGYILIGDVARAGIYTSLIRGQTPLSTIDFELICKKPQLMAFSKKERQRKLNIESEQII